jgi:thioredoxin 1
MSETDDIEELRERRKEELRRRLDADGEAGDGGPDDASADRTGPSEPIHVEGSDHLDDLVGRYDVVLVDFYADWCGPCKMLEPTVEELAAETSAAVAKVDVDQHGALAQQYRVQGVPTLVLFADGEAVEQVVGVKQKHELAGLVDRYS